MLFKRKNRTGQGMIEYIIIGALIALSLIVVVSLFGNQEKKQFAAMTKALSGEDVVVDGIAKEIDEEMEKDPSLSEYRQPSTISKAPPPTHPEKNPPSSPPPSNPNPPPSEPIPPKEPPPNPPPDKKPPENTPPSVPPKDPPKPPTPEPPKNPPNTNPPATPPKPPTPPAPPPPPPDPVPVGIDPLRHHIGDGSYGQGLGGGSMTNEGTNYSKTFNVDLTKAKAAGVQYAVLTIYTSGINRDMITTQNMISLNDQNLGELDNGKITFKIPITRLNQGSNTIRIAAGSGMIRDPYGFPIKLDYDDFEFWNLSLTWEK